MGTLIGLVLLVALVAGVVAPALRTQTLAKIGFDANGNSVVEIVNGVLLFLVATSFFSSVLVGLLVTGGAYAYANRDRLLRR